MAEERFSLVMDLGIKAVTQSTVNNFNSLCRIGDHYLAANEDGIYSINRDAGAAGSNIDAYFIIYKTDFGIYNSKRLRSMFIGYECDGDLLITVTADETWSRTFTMPPVHSGNEQHGNKVPLTRDIKGRFYTFKFANSSGSDFSIDRISVKINTLPPKPRGITL